LDPPQFALKQKKKKKKKKQKKKKKKQTIIIWCKYLLNHPNKKKYNFFILYILFAEPLSIAPKDLLEKLGLQ